MISRWALAMALAAQAGGFALGSNSAEAQTQSAAMMRTGWACDGLREDFIDTAHADLDGLRKLLNESIALQCTDVTDEISRAISMRDTPPGPCERANYLLPWVQQSISFAEIDRYLARFGAACPEQAAVAQTRREYVSTHPPGDLPVLAYNRDISYSISRSDPVTQEGEVELRYDQYSVALLRGEGVRLTMRSEAFDPLLAIGAGRLPDSYRSSAVNAGSAGGGEVALQFVAPADGEYVVAAASTSGRSQLGAYTISMRRAPPPALPRAVQRETPMTSALGADSPRGDRSAPYELWALQAFAGEGMIMSMQSAAFDTYLSLGRMENGQFRELASNDDYDGRNSLLRYRFDSEGTYFLVARSYRRGGLGPYQLTVNMAPDASTAVRTPIDNRTTAWVQSGSLSTSSPVDANFIRFQDFEFEPPRRGRTYVVTAHSSDFRPVVEYGESAPLGQAVSLHSNGHREQPNQVALVPTAAGTYLVRVRGHSPEDDGTFEIVITEQ